MADPATAPRGPCLAWAIAAAAISHALQAEPLPPGLSHADIGDWQLTVNNSAQEQAGHPPFEIRAIHKVYVAMASFGPHDGAIMGGSEDQFIKDIAASLPEQTQRLFLPEFLIRNLTRSPA